MGITSVTVTERTLDRLCKPARSPRFASHQGDHMGILTDFFNKPYGLRTVSTDTTNTQDESAPSTEKSSTAERPTVGSDRGSFDWRCRTERPCREQRERRCRDQRESGSANRRTAREASICPGRARCGEGQVSAQGCRTGELSPSDGTRNAPPLHQRPG